MKKHFFINKKKRLYKVILLFLFTSFTFGQSILDPDQFHGPRTKWHKFQGGQDGDTRASISPNMRGLTMAVWYSALEALGANSATFNLEAREGLLPPGQPMHANPFLLTEEQIQQYEFTPEQRNQVLINFLQQVQDTYNAGQISGNIKFHVHQRLYPNTTAKEQDFVTDFSEFINAVKAANLDHWIAGIRLGENGIESTQLNKTLRLALEWTTAINANTNNWLLSHGFEMSGGKMGLYFNNIHNRALSSTFFQNISQQTGYFTFCYKHFNADGFNNALTTLGYNTNSVADWKTYLNNDCGFSNLKTFINNHRVAYPMHANVIFVGDSGDAMRLINNVQYQALTELFTEAGEGYTGIIGMNGYTWDFENSIGDVYKNMYIVDPAGTTPQLQSNSKKRWQHWPLHDGTNTLFIDAMSSIEGVILPSGPIPVNNGASQTFTIVPISGYVVDDVIVDGVSQGALTSYTFNNVITTHAIQARYKPATFSIDDIQQDNGINIYPNPVTNNTFEINFKKMNFNYGETIKVTLTNVTGQRVFENDFANNDSPIKIEKNLSKGIYLLNIKTKEKVYYKKLIIK